jgi:hypothetical protein
MGQSKTSKYYASNPEAAEKRREYQRELNKTDKQKKYRSDHNKANRKAGTYGNGDGVDMSSTKSGKFVKEKASINRARNGSNGKSTKK